MKLTNEEVYGAVTALKELSGQQLPVLTSYKLNKLVKDLRAHYEVIEATRLGIVKKYAPEGSKGLTPNNEIWDTFIVDYQELMQQTVELNFEVVPVKVENGLTITPAALGSLEKFVEFKFDKET